MERTRQDRALRELRHRNVVWTSKYGVHADRSGLLIRSVQVFILEATRTNTKYYLL